MKKINLKKFKVDWTETVVKSYHDIILAESVEDAFNMISKDIDGSRTGVLEEDYEDIMSVDISSIIEIKEKQ